MDTLSEETIVKIGLSPFCKRSSLKGLSVVESKLEVTKIVSLVNNNNNNNNQPYL